MRWMKLSEHQLINLSIFAGVSRKRKVYIGMIFRFSLSACSFMGRWWLMPVWSWSIRWSMSNGYWSVRYLVFACIPHIGIMDADCYCLIIWQDGWLNDHRSILVCSLVRSICAHFTFFRAAGSVQTGISMRITMRAIRARRWDFLFSSYLFRRVVIRLCA